MRILLLTIFNLIFLFFIKGQNNNELDSLKTLLNHAKNDTTKCYYLDKIVELEIDPTRQLNYNEQMRVVSQKNIDLAAQEKTIINVFKKYLSHAYNNSGYLAALHGNFKQALSDYNLSLNIRNEIKSDYFVMQSLQNIGMLYLNSGNVKEALAFYMRGLKIAEQTNDKKNIASSFNYIAGIYSSQGNGDKAMEYYTKSLELFKSLNDEKGMSEALNNLAYQYDLTGNKEKALDYYLKSMELSLKLNNKGFTATLYNNLASIYGQMGEATKSVDYYNKSLKMCEELNDIEGIVFAKSNLGTAFMKQGDSKKARTYLETSLELSKKLGNPDLISSIAKRLTKLYKSINLYAKALEMHELYVLMRDSVNNQLNKDEMLKTELNYEYDKKELLLKKEHEKEQLLATEKNRAQKLIIYFVAFGLLLVVSFSIFVFRRLQITRQQKIIIEQQKEIVEEKQKEIFESIHYAKRIQSALIANKALLSKNLQNHFVLFKPKDIVSGDFYWVTEHNNKFYLAVCDSTGHGIPGAFMSLLNMGFLSEAIKEKDIEKPNEVFNFIRERLISTIGNEGQQDGMDAVLLCINKTHKTITYSAANNSPLLVRDNQIIELPKDKMPVGKGEKVEEFQLYSIDIKEGDSLYLYTDGYADQFGGEKGKKYRYKALNQMLISICNKPMNEQNDFLQHHFEEWRGNLEQVDDVTVIGIRL